MIELDGTPEEADWAHGDDKEPAPPVLSDAEREQELADYGVARREFIEPEPDPVFEDPDTEPEIDPELVNEARSRVARLELQVAELLLAKVSDTSLDVDAVTAAPRRRRLHQAANAAEKLFNAFGRVVSGAKGGWDRNGHWHDPNTGRYAPKGYVSAKVLKGMLRGDGPSRSEFLKFLNKKVRENPDFGRGSWSDRIAAEALGPRPHETEALRAWEAAYRELRNWHSNEVRRRQALSIDGGVEQPDEVRLEAISEHAHAESIKAAAKAAAPDGVWLVAKDNYLSRIGVSRGQSVKVRWDTDDRGIVDAFDPDGNPVPVPVKWARFVDDVTAVGERIERPVRRPNATRRLAGLGGTVAARAKAARGEPVDAVLADNYLAQYGWARGEPVKVRYLSDTHGQIVGTDGRADRRAAWARFVDDVPEESARERLTDGPTPEVDPFEDRAAVPSETIPEPPPPAPEVGERVGLADPGVAQLPVGSSLKAVDDDVWVTSRGDGTWDVEVAGDHPRWASGMTTDAVVDDHGDMWAVESIPDTPPRQAPEEVAPPAPTPEAEPLTPGEMVTFGPDIPAGTVLEAGDNRYHVNGDGTVTVEATGTTLTPEWGDTPLRVAEAERPETDDVAADIRRADPTSLESFVAEANEQRTGTGLAVPDETPQADPFTDDTAVPTVTTTDPPEVPASSSVPAPPVEPPAPPTEEPSTSAIPDDVWGALVGGDRNPLLNWLDANVDASTIGRNPRAIRAVVGRRPASGPRAVAWVTANIEMRQWAAVKTRASDKDLSWLPGFFAENADGWDTDAYVRVAQALYDHDLPGGFRAVVNAELMRDIAGLTEEEGAATFEVIGEFVGPDGEHAGTFTRTLAFTDTPGGAYVEHGSIEVVDEYQRRGLGGSFFALSMDAYEQTRGWITEAHVHAVSGDGMNGGLTWALLGAQWSDTGMPPGLLMVMRGATDDPDVIREIEDLQRRATEFRPGDPEYPTPFDLAMVGESKRTVDADGRETWVGREVMASAADYWAVFPVRPARDRTPEPETPTPTPEPETLASAGLPVADREAASSPAAGGAEPPEPPEDAAAPAPDGYTPGTRFDVDVPSHVEALTRAPEGTVLRNGTVTAVRGSGPDQWTVTSPGTGEVWTAISSDLLSRLPEFEIGSEWTVEEPAAPTPGEVFHADRLEDGLRLSTLPAGTVLHSVHDDGTGNTYRATRQSDGDWYIEARDPTAWPGAADWSDRASSGELRNFDNEWVVPDPDAPAPVADTPAGLPPSMTATSTEADFDALPAGTVLEGFGTRLTHGDDGLWRTRKGEVFPSARLTGLDWTVTAGDTEPERPAAIAPTPEPVMPLAPIEPFDDTQEHVGALDNTDGRMVDRLDALPLGTKLTPPSGGTVYEKVTHGWQATDTGVVVEPELFTADLWHGGEGTFTFHYRPPTPSAEGTGTSDDPVEPSSRSRRGQFTLAEFSAFPAGSKFEVNGDTYTLGLTGMWTSEQDGTTWPSDAFIFPNGKTAEGTLTLPGGDATHIGVAVPVEPSRYTADELDAFPAGTVLHTGGVPFTRNSDGRWVSGSDDATYATADLLMPDGRSMNVTVEFPAPDPTGRTVIASRGYTPAELDTQPEGTEFRTSGFVFTRTEDGWRRPDGQTFSSLDFTLGDPDAQIEGEMVLVEADGPRFDPPDTTGMPAGVAPGEFIGSVSRAETRAQLESMPTGSVIATRTGVRFTRQADGTWATPMPPKRGFGKDTFTVDELLATSRFPDDDYSPAARMELWLMETGLSEGVMARHKESGAVATHMGRDRWRIRRPDGGTEETEFVDLLAEFGENSEWEVIEATAMTPPKPRWAGPWIVTRHPYVDADHPVAPQPERPAWLRPNDGSREFVAGPATPRMVERAVQVITSDLLSRIPGYVVESVLEHGRLITQHESGSSHGYYGPDTRANLEHWLFGAPRDMPPVERPFYGAFANSSFDREAYDPASAYGEVHVIFRPEIADRTTVTFGDSLGADRASTPLIVGDARREIEETGTLDPVSVHQAHVRPWRGEGASWRSYAELQFHGGIDIARDVERIEVARSELTSVTPGYGRGGVTTERDAITRLARFTTEYGIPVYIVETDGTKTRITVDDSSTFETGEEFVNFSDSGFDAVKSALDHREIGTRLVSVDDDGFDGWWEKQADGTWRSHTGTVREATDFAYRARRYRVDPPNTEFDFRHMGYGDTRIAELLDPLPVGTTLRSGSIGRVKKRDGTWAVLGRESGPGDPPGALSGIRWEATIPARVEPELPAVLDLRDSRRADSQRALDALPLGTRITNPDMGTFEKRAGGMWAYVRRDGTVSESRRPRTAASFGGEAWAVLSEVDLTAGTAASTIDTLNGYAVGTIITRPSGETWRKLVSGRWERLNRDGTPSSGRRRRWPREFTRTGKWTVTPPLPARASSSRTHTLEFPAGLSATEVLAAYPPGTIITAPRSGTRYRKRPDGRWEVIGGSSTFDPSAFDGSTGTWEVVVP